jgi:hypothetical protein
MYLFDNGIEGRVRDSARWRPPSFPQGGDSNETAITPPPATSHQPYPTCYWLLAIGYWLLAIGYWLLAIGYWLAEPSDCLLIANSYRLKIHSDANLRPNRTS